MRWWDVLNADRYQGKRLMHTASLLVMLVLGVVKVRIHEVGRLPRLLKMYSMMVCTWAVGIKVSVSEVLGPPLCRPLPAAANLGQDNGGRHVRAVVDHRDG